MNDTSEPIARPSKEHPLVDGERFTTAWIDIAKFPGGMMMSSHGGKFGPVPATTGCSITTSPLIADEWRARGSPVIEIQLTSAETPDVLRVGLAKDVYDDGQDHHPATYVGRKGDIVVIHSIQTAVVSHSGTGHGFVVHDGELELAPAAKAGDVDPNSKEALSLDLEKVQTELDDALAALAEARTHHDILHPTCNAELANALNGGVL
jgi:hypothetical protein